MVWNPIQGISDWLNTVVSNTFNAVQIFLMRLELIGINSLEIILFLVFLLVVVVVIVAPARVWLWIREFSVPIQRFMNWVKN